VEVQFGIRGAFVYHCCPLQCVKGCTKVDIIKKMRTHVVEMDANVFGTWFIHVTIQRGGSSSSRR